MIEILHDPVYQNPRNFGSIEHMLVAQDFKHIINSKCTSNNGSIPLKEPQRPVLNIRLGVQTQTCRPPPDTGSHAVGICSLPSSSAAWMLEGLSKSAEY